MQQSNFFHYWTKVAITQVIRLCINTIDYTHINQQINQILISGNPLRCPPVRLSLPPLGTPGGLRPSVVRTGVRTPRTFTRCRRRRRRRRPMAISNPRHAPDQASASPVREDAYASQHRIRPTILRNDILEGFLQ